MSKVEELISEVKKLDAKATPGPWWTNGLDIEAAKVTVAEGEELIQLYDTITEKPTKKIKLYATEGPFTKESQGFSQDAVLLLTTSSILDDKPYEEAKAAAELIAHYRTACPKLAKACEVMMKALKLNSIGEFSMERELASEAIAEVERILSE